MSHAPALPYYTRSPFCGQLAVLPQYMRDTSPSARVSLVLGDDLVRGAIAERLVRPDAVVDGFGLPQELVLRYQILGDVHEIVKLFLMRPVGPLHFAIQPRAAGREDKERDPQGLTLPL